MAIRKRIGIIGCGNMGRAIISGVLKNRIANRKQIFIFDAVRSQMARAAHSFKVRQAKSNRDLAGRADIILLAVKPQDLKTVASEIRGLVRSHQIVVSILAGTPITKLKRLLGMRPLLVRAMPNLGAQVGEAITAIAGANRAALNAAELIFSGCGRVIRLPERHFDLVTAVSGSGPAYFFLLMELLSKAARQGGIPSAAARLLAVQTALGAARLAQMSSDSPEELRQKVTSKKGTTDAALRFLWKKKFGAIFIQGIRQAVKRARQLSRD